MTKAFAFIKQGSLPVECFREEGLCLFRIELPRKRENSIYLSHIHRYLNTFISTHIYVCIYIYVCVCVCVCYYAFPYDRNIFKRACMSCRVRETTLCTVARKVKNCVGNEIFSYVKASDCLHDCISVTCTWGSHPAFILNIYCD